MPGIVTHSKLLKESISCLSKKDKKSYLLRSLETLLATPEHHTAALFGAIGPNLFDYIPVRNKKNYYGNEISFFLHNGGSGKIINTMIQQIYSYKDKNNEWSAMQRAYLYGFISHIIADYIFHPYIFYYSGFPDIYTRKEIYHYREQNLLFQYNLDNYLQYHDEKLGAYEFNLSEMLPIRKKRFLYTISPPIKNLILGSLKKSYPDIFKKVIIVSHSGNNDDLTGNWGYLDTLPYLIRLAYWIKRKNNRQLANFMRYIRQKNIFYSDFIIRYPMQKRYNKNILNLHRERWEIPVGKPGLHYDSILNLITLTCDRTIELWEKIETSIYEKENREVLGVFNFNAYTGDGTLSYHDMKFKRPIKLSR